MNVPGLMPLPDVTVDAASLRDGAHALRAEARRAEERYEEARDAWRQLREAYRHDGTEELPAVLDATTVPDRPRIIDGLEAHPEITTSDGFNDFKKPYSEVFP